MQEVPGLVEELFENLKSQIATSSSTEKKGEKDV